MIKLAIKQKGAALIFFVFLISLVATGFLLKSLSTSNLLKTSQDDKAAKILADAKAALVGYTLSRVGSGERPGNMPNPDRLLTPNETPPVGGPPNYDGDPDSCTGTGAGMNCFGRLPWKAIGMSIPAPTQNDSTGIMPWYAVSANLADPTCMSVINPSILNMTDNGTYPCGGTTLLPHPWLTVRDARGNVLSNRVAIVLMLPGAAINGQSRLSSPLNGATSYLDSVSVLATCSAPCVPGTYSNADTDNDFIMAAGITGASADANDRLLYITIEELMEILTDRAAGELRIDLNAYRAANGIFPSASSLAAPLGTNNYVAGGGDSGTVPIDMTDKVTCSYSAISDDTTCSIAFSLIGNVSLRRLTGTYNQWDTRAGACNISPASTCTCTGAGSCDTAFSHFTCNASGVCVMNLSSGSTGKYIYTVPSHGSIRTVTFNCSVIGVNAECTGGGNGTFDIGLNVPTWFRDNLWQDYFYYHKRTAADLQVGARTGIQALVIGTGSPIIAAPFAVSKGSAQTRPSALINNYLDSAENTDADLVFDATTTPRSASYNDQSFIIAP